MIDVLVLEDDHLVRGQIVDTLEGAGYAVREAEGADDAMEVLRGGGARLVIADMQLQGGAVPEDGHDLAARVAELHPAIAVIFMSGDREALARRALSASQRRLAKPFAPRDLLAAVRDILT